MLLLWSNKPFDNADCNRSFARQDRCWPFGLHTSGCDNPGAAADESVSAIRMTVDLAIVDLCPEQLVHGNEEHGHHSFCRPRSQGQHLQSTRLRDLQAPDIK